MTKYRIIEEEYQNGTLMFVLEREDLIPGDLGITYQKKWVVVKSAGSAVPLVDYIRSLAPTRTLFGEYEI